MLHFNLNAVEYRLLGGTGHLEVLVAAAEVDGSEVAVGEIARRPGNLVANPHIPPDQPSLLRDTGGQCGEKPRFYCRLLDLWRRARR